MEKIQIIIAVSTQLIFLSGELPASYYLNNKGFTLNSFAESWFAIFFVTRLIGIAGQIYLWSGVPIGKVNGVTAMVALILSNVLGVIILGQKQLNATEMSGLSFAILAMILMTTKSS